MSSFHLRFADKENSMKQVGGHHAKENSKLAVQNDGENFKVSKKPVSGPGPRRTRVPLSGKDQNKAFPNLQRSQSSVAQPVQPLKQSRRRVLPSQKVPTLRKANSSLGFIHQKSFEVSSDPFSKVLLNHQLQPKFTDSLVKKQDNSVPLPSIPSLASTLSTNTQALHSSNLPEILADVDPVKRSRGISLPAIPQHLIDDENSVETIPEPTKLKYQPHDIAPLTEDDLKFFSQPSRKVTDENRYDDPEFLQYEINSKFDEIYLDEELDFDREKENEEVDFDNQPNPDSVGLTITDLNDLLDF